MRSRPTKHRFGRAAGAELPLRSEKARAPNRTALDIVEPAINMRPGRALLGARDHKAMATVGCRLGSSNEKRRGSSLDQSDSKHSHEKGRAKTHQTCHRDLACTTLTVTEIRRREPKGATKNAWTIA